METLISSRYDLWLQLSHWLNDLLLTLSILYVLQPIRKSDLPKVDPWKACEFFKICFKDPSTFTIVTVENIDPTIVIPLILHFELVVHVGLLF